MMRRQSAMSQGASLEQTTVAETWNLAIVAASGLSGHWGYVDTLAADGVTWIGIGGPDWYNKPTPFGGKIGFSPHAINDSPVRVHCWLDAYVYRPDGSEAKHVVVDALVPSGGELNIEGKEIIVTADQPGVWTGKAVFLLDSPA